MHEFYREHVLWDKSIVPIVLAASSRIPVLVAPTATAAAATASASAGRSLAVVSATSSSIVECASLLRRRRATAATTAAAAADKPATAAAKPTTTAAKPTTAWSFFTRGTFAFGMSKIDNEASAANVDTAQSFDGTFGRFRAGHRDKPEAAFATIGVHGQVNSNDGARAG